MTQVHSGASTSMNRMLSSAIFLTWLKGDNRLSLARLLTIHGLNPRNTWTTNQLSAARLGRCSWARGSSPITAVRCNTSSFSPRETVTRPDTVVRLVQLELPPALARNDGCWSVTQPNARSRHVAEGTLPAQPNASAPLARPPARSWLASHASIRINAAFG